MYRTTDLWFAAFLIKRGYNVVDIERNGGRGSWGFEISEDEHKKLKIEFSNSEVSEIKFTIEKLKDMIY